MRSHSQYRRGDGNSYAEILLASSSSSNANGNHRRTERGMRYDAAKYDQTFSFNRGGNRSNNRSNHCNGNARPIVSKSNSTLNFRAAVMKNASKQNTPLSSTNGIATAAAPPNTYNQNTKTNPNNINTVHKHHGYYHRHKTRDDNPMSTHIKEQHQERNRRPLTSYNYQSSIVNSSSKQFFYDNNTIPELIQIAHVSLDTDTLKPSSIAAFWHKVMKQMSGNSATKNKRLPNHDYLDKRLDMILQHTLRNLDDFDHIPLSQTIYSMAKLVDVLRKNRLSRSKRGENVITDKLRELLLSDNKSPKTELFLSFAITAVRMIRQFKARSLSNIAYAYALIGDVPVFEDGSNLFDYIAEHAIQRVTEFNSQALANTVWAYATVGAFHPTLFERVADQIASSSTNILDSFNSQEIANLVWAYAKADARHLNVFKKVANHIVSSSELDSFNSQHIANTVWAFAKANVRSPKLFKAVANHIVASNILDRFNPQALANTVWAYATNGTFHPKLFEKVSNHIIESNILDRFNPQALANTVWAYATTGAFHPKLFEKVSNHICESNILDRFIPQELANAVWAYASAEAHHPTFFEEVSKHIIESNILDRFSSQDIANTVWAFASMDIVNKQLFTMCALKAANSIYSFNSQELTNMAWAYAVADVDAPSLFNDHFIIACLSKMEQFEIKDFRQLYQWHLWRTYEMSSQGLPDNLSQRCFEEFISEEPRVSMFQADVVAQLEAIGLVPKEEALLESGYRIDAVVEVNGKTIGVEVDGPTHFIGKSRSPTGSTTLKRRQVSSIDRIELVSVPYWDWNMLGQSDAKKQHYLRKLLHITD